MNYLTKSQNGMKIQKIECTHVVNLVCMQKKTVESYSGREKFVNF